MDFWTFLLNIVALLALSFALGSLCERLRQSALLGYLVAGMLLGPNALHVVSTGKEVDGLAELGVSLLLFSLGLEFSWRRLRSLGLTALFGGAMQVGTTLVAVSGGAYLLGLPFSAAVVVGSAFALSSTAGVLRVLMQRSEIDSVHGRFALGILLFQDLAVIPLVLLVGFLADSGDGGSALTRLGQTALALAGMVLGFWLLFSVIAPRVFLAASAARNRELPVLLAVIGALASIWIAHELGLSPAVGAFIAGMLLGESPLATQVRADLGVLRTLLVTLFFGSIGMLADPGWMLANAPMLLGIVLAVVVTKVALVWLSLRIVRRARASALAAGMCLAQVGEFAFVIAGSVRGTLVDDELFLVIVSTMMLTLFLTPYLVALAPVAAPVVFRWIWRRPGIAVPGEDVQHESRHGVDGRVLLIGYGPAGERCAVALLAAEVPVTVLDLNPRLVDRARAASLDARVGDATLPEVLEHMDVSKAHAVVLALPDPKAAENVLEMLRSCAPELPVIVRSRYNRHVGALIEAGATVAVDEESVVGEALGAQVLDVVKPTA